MRLFLFLWVFFFLPSFGAEVKIIATVNGEAISNTDLAQQQKVISMMVDGLKVSDSEALEALIRHHLFIDHAKKLGITIPEKSVSDAVEFFIERGLPNDISTASLEDYIRGELTYRKVIEELILPSIKISNEQVESQIPLLRQKQDGFNILQIGNETTELGWVNIDELNESIRKEVLKTSMGKETKFIGDNKFKVLDRENSLILFSNFELETQDKKTLEIQPKDLNKKSRDNLISATGTTTIDYEGKQIKVKVLNSNLKQLIRMELYENEAIKKEDELRKELLKNAVVVKK